MKIILAGILKNGFILAEKIKLNLEKISGIKIILCSVEVDKKTNKSSQNKHKT